MKQREIGEKLVYHHKVLGLKSPQHSLAVFELILFLMRQKIMKIKFQILCIKFTCLLSLKSIFNLNNALTDAEIIKYCFNF